MRIWFLAALTTMLFASGGVLAQDSFPSRGITILIGYPPGGSIDTTSRALAPVLQRLLGQPVVVLNRPGAAAVVGTQQVAIAAPDGYTITVATTQLALSPAVDQVFGRPPTFTRDMFRPIALVSADPSILFVGANQPWQTLQDLVADARKRPGAILYASGGLYGTTHIAVEIFLKATATQMRHLPTAGGGPALLAVLGDNAQLLAAHPAVGGPQVKSGKLRALATMGAKRVSSFPDVPTLQELGYDGEYYQWNGVFVPAKVPEPIVAIWREAVAKAVKEPDYIEAMRRLGTDVLYLDGDEFKTWWDRDSRRTEDAVRAIGRVH